MIAALLSIAIAQTTPGTSPVASAVPSADASPLPSGIPSSVPTPEGLIRRMPITAPVLKDGDIMIRNSGSTNTAGYTIVVHPDFVADITSEGNTQQKTIAEPQAKWLFKIVKDAAPFTDLGGRHCMKSASFGSVTTVSYDGATTPDLSCGGGDASREITRTIGVIMGQIGLNPAPGRFRRRLL